MKEIIDFELGHDAAIQNCESSIHLY